MKEWFNSKFERLDGESEEAYATRMADLAWHRTIELVGSVIAIAILLAVLIFVWATAPNMSNYVTIAKYNELVGKYNTLYSDSSKYKESHPDVAPAPAVCPAAGNVTITTEQYDKLKARPETCNKPKVVHKPKSPKREVIITERKEERREKVGDAQDHCIFRIYGEIKATASFPKGQGETKCPAWRDEMLERYHRNPNDLIWAKKYPNGKPE